MISIVSPTETWIAEELAYIAIGYTKYRLGDDLFTDDEEDE